VKFEHGGWPDHAADGEMAMCGYTWAMSLFVGSEGDHRRGDETLNARSADDTQGQRTSVTRYDVAIRMAV